MRVAPNRISPSHLNKSYDTHLANMLSYDELPTLSVIKSTVMHEEKSYCFVAEEFKMEGSRDYFSTRKSTSKSR